MKYARLLDERDIKTILSKEFNVPMEDVTLDVYKETIGYGPAEHDETRIKACVISDKM